MATEAERLRLTRATLLGQLQKYDESKTGVVPAPNFVASIKSLGLNFGGLDFSILPAFFLLNALTNAVPALGADASVLLDPSTLM